MNNYLIKFHTFFVLIFNSIVSFLLIILFSKKRNSLINFTSFKINRSCYILGNGPSINSFLNSFDYNSNCDFFCVNYFALTKFFNKLKPNFYVLLDPKLFPRSIHEYNSHKKLNDLILKLNGVDWKITLFVPYKFKNSIVFEKLSNEKITIVFINSTTVKGFNFFEHLCFRFNLGMPSPQTVINAAIFIAINFRYEHINLIGVEQSWLKDLSVDNNNQVNVSLDHFYSGSSSLGRHSSLNTLSTFLFSQYLCFLSHERLRSYADSTNVIILNHTSGSYIDAYERNIRH